ncbi:MAG TPA: glycosyltransferase [Trueperaceae bacterium]|nr:glycosyltransferase [Trueperaceae bacterium]
MPALRVAFLIPVFPEIHNTFIINQITGLLDRGVDLHLYPLAVGSYEEAHAEVAQYRLRERDKHLRVPGPHLERLRGAARRLLEPRSWNPGVIDAINPLRGRDTWSLLPAYTALSFAANRDYDILHAQFGHLAPLAERLIAKGGVRASLVASFRGADTTSHLPRNPEAYRRVFEHGSLFLPVSEDLRARLLAAGSPEKRTLVHRSGVDLRRFEFATRSRGADEPTEVLFVGRFVEKKGIRDALAAVAGALGQLPALPSGEPAMRLTLIGSGPLEEELRRLAGEFGVSDSVSFAGTRDADGVAEVMRASHLLLAPSVTAASGDKEGVPNVIKEAMASGMPVLATLHGGIPELVDDGVSGFLVPEHDVEGLTRRLVTLVGSPESWEALGRAGRAKVEAEFDSESLNDLLLERYREVIARGRPAGG